MVIEKLRLDGKVAIVTGAGRGIGRAIALALAEAGAAVVCSARTQVEIDDTVAEICAAGSSAVAIRADVLEENDLQHLVDETLAQFGRLDIVVNNAGGGDFNPFLDISAEAFRYQFDWNTTSAFLLSRIAAPTMLSGGGGVILNISSGAGRIGIRGMLSYGVAKAALDHLTRCMAEELAPKIRVNGLALGAIMTSALEKTLAMEPGFREKLIEKTPLKAIGDPDDIALAALFLCSPGASYITGTVLTIDGGIQDTNLPFKLADL